MDLQRTICAECYSSPIKFALVIQFGIGLVCTLALDGGGLARVCACGVLGFWIGIILMLFRRPFHPTRFDLLAIRYGFVAAFGAAATWASWLS
jgi:hypothetical protein